VAGTTAAIALLFLYTPWLKRVPLLGHAVVGLLAAMCLGFGGLVAGRIPPVLLPAFAFGLLFGGRELLKTLYDTKGDRVAGAPTATTRWGPRVTVAIAALCFIGALLALSTWAGGKATRWLVPLLTLLLVLSTLLPLRAGSSSRLTVRRALIWSKLAGLALLFLFATL
jgi:4-hydroxybenzoate polyprenyltransferase